MLSAESLAFSESFTSRSEGAPQEGGRYGQGQAGALKATEASKEE